jgi:hypothetical protein
MVEKQLNVMIQRRTREGKMGPDEREKLWQESVRAYTARRREEMRAAWCESTTKDRPPATGSSSRPS